MDWIGLDWIGLDWAASIGSELIGADLAVLDKVGSDLFIFIVRQFLIQAFRPSNCPQRSQK